MVRCSLVCRRDSPWFLVGVATPFRAACGVLAVVSYLEHVGDRNLFLKCSAAQGAASDDIG